MKSGNLRRDGGCPASSPPPVSFFESLFADKPGGCRAAGTGLAADLRILLSMQMERISLLNRIFWLYISSCAAKKRSPNTRQYQYRVERKFTILLIPTRFCDTIK